MMDRIAQSVERDPSYQARIHFTQNSARADYGRRARRIGAPNRFHRQRHRDGLLHKLRRDRTAHRPRASASSVAGDEPLAACSAEDGSFVGCSCRPFARRRELRGDGREGQAHGAPPPDREGRRQDRTDGWNPVRHRGLDQRAPRRSPDRRRARSLSRRWRLSGTIEPAARRPARGRGIRSARLFAPAALLLRRATRPPTAKR